MLEISDTLSSIMTSEATTEAGGGAGGCNVAHCKKNIKYYPILCQKFLQIVKQNLNFPPFFNFVYKQIFSCLPVQKTREIQNEITKFVCFYSKNGIGEKFGGILHCAQLKNHAYFQLAPHEILYPVFNWFTMLIYNFIFGLLIFTAKIVNSLPTAAENCQCGKSLKRKMIPRIWGGNETDIQTYPWHIVLHVYLEFHYSDYIGLNPICGGSLITYQFVLTAYHCIHSNSLLVRLKNFTM